MANISLDAVRKEFGDTIAVDGIDLEIRDGEFFCLLGPSGCGKTTTLRMIAGLETQTSGDIEIGGETVNDTKPKDRNLAMVFQSHAVYPHLNVFENLAFPLRAEGFDDDDIDRRVHEVAAMLDIDDKLEQDTTSLSGGQRQRVALGRAMIRSPRAFLMDEPLSSLDANLRRQMRVEISDLQSELDTTAVYVTHDQVEAMTMADRIAVLRDGDVAQVGAPLEVYNEPLNQWVANFLGNPGMNFFDVEVTDDGVEVAGARLTLPEEKRAALEGLRAVTLGVRPENIAEASGEGIRARVEAIEQIGDSVVLHLDADGERFQAKVETKRQAYERGDEITVEFDERLHFFDGDEEIVTRVTDPREWTIQPKLRQE